LTIVTTKQREREGSSVTTSAELVLAEFRVALEAAESWPLLRAVIALATDRVDGGHHRIRLLSSTYVPTDSRVLCLFSADSVKAVEDIYRTANISVVGIRTAVDLAALTDRRTNA
jgi:hypothetical protein